MTVPFIFRVKEPHELSVCMSAELGEDTHEAKKADFELCTLCGVCSVEQSFLMFRKCRALHTPVGILLIDAIEQLQQAATDVVWDAAHHACSAQVASEPCGNSTAILFPSGLAGLREAGAKARRQRTEIVVDQPAASHRVHGNVAGVWVRMEETVAQLRARQKRCSKAEVEGTWPCLIYSEVASHTKICATNQLCRCIM